MTLAFTLDTARFRKLVDDALRKIPTASRGQWTLHAPVDPGITLVELFAWLLDQRSFWADQISEPLVRGVMALYGDAIRTARPAGTAITFAPELELGTHHARIFRRTPLRIPETELVFTLHQGLFALALERYTDAPAEPILRLADPAAEMDLRTGRPIEILAANGEPASFALGISLAAAAPASAEEPISILFELDTTVPPEWSPEATTVQPPATLAWEYQTTGGDWKPLPQLRDATLGLRRSGTLRFALPFDWSATAADGDGKFVGWLRATTAAATYSAPPSVLAIAPNTGIAFHYQWQVKSQAPEWLPLPGRTIQLDPGQLPLAARTIVLVWETPVAPGQRKRQRWRVVPDLATSGPDDRVCVVDRARATITFGDGLTGKLPRLDPAEPIQVSVVYEAGGGTAGNVAPCAWEPLAGPLGSARSYVSALGGLDDETLDQARARSASALRTPSRAVTPDDHQTIATTTPGIAIARAHAEVGLALGECLVQPGMTTVFVVPEIHSRDRDAVRAGTAIAAPLCDPGALAEVRMRFARTRLLGELVAVENAVYRHARIRVRVVGAPHDREGVRRRVGAAIRLFLDPLLGGDGDGWPFGEPVRPTALLGVAQRELGDRGDVDEIAISLDGAPFETCSDVPLAPYELVAVDEVEIAIATTSNQEAGLR